MVTPEQLDAGGRILALLQVALLLLYVRDRYLL